MKSKKPTPEAAGDESLRPALEAISKIDSDFSTAYLQFGLPPVRSIEASFAGLVNMIISQQVSIQSAQAIWGRLQQQAKSVSPKGILEIGEEGLKAAGLSKPKQKYVMCLADDILSGRLKLKELTKLNDQEVIDRLIQTKGIGQWTCEIYLLLALKRPDIMPAGDIALQKAMQDLKGLSDRPLANEMYELSEKWRPHRSAGARFLWHCYKKTPA